MNEEDKDRIETIRRAAQHYRDMAFLLGIIDNLSKEGEAKTEALRDYEKRVNLLEAELEKMMPEYR